MVTKIGRRAPENAPQRCPDMQSFQRTRAEAVMGAHTGLSLLAWPTTVVREDNFRRWCPAASSRGRRRERGSLGRQSLLHLFAIALTARQTIDSPITEAERERFIWYAQHIHSIYLHTTLHIDHSVFHYLSNAHLGSPLMPQLRKLYVAPGFPLCRGMASLLSGPALRMLNCGTDYQSCPSPPHGHPGVPRTLLADFVTCSPGVESLVVGECADFSLILKPIGALRGLRKLDVSRACFPFGIEFLRALDHLDQLEHLLLSDTFHASAAPPCGGLKGVKKLTILGGASTVPALLASLPYMRLRELCISSITFRAVIDGETRLSMSSLSFDDVGMLAAALSEGPGKNLEKLSLEDSVAGQALLHEPVSTLIAPFFALQGIRHFKLSSSQALVITNEDLQKIGRAWPKLEHLCLTYTGYGAAPTMGGIVELANVCPRLASLSLSTVIPVVAEGDVVPPLKAYDVSKFSFEVWIPDQRIRDVGQLARVLCSAFGRLQIGKLDRGHFRKWSAVLDRMEAYIEETERWYGIQIPQ